MTFWRAHWSLLLTLFTAIVPAVLGSLSDLVVVVLDQPHSGQQSWSKVQDWRQELSASERGPVILGSQELAPSGAAWTVVPLFPKLLEYNEADWFLIASEHTLINFTALEEVLATFDPSRELFLGHALTDAESTITHHYAPTDFIQYPSLPSGMVLSRPALRRAAEHVQDFNVSFNIDPQYELAVFLKYHHSLSPAVPIATPPPAPPPTALVLTHVPQLCVAPPPLPEDGSCATVYSHEIPACPERPELVPGEVHFAVKTCSKYHASRLPVVWQTWAPDTDGSITYYSEVASEEYATVDIGVPNTERGHCGKTLAIIQKFHAALQARALKWLVIADDDTLLSVPRLLRLLHCYDHTHPMLLGEVYGYRAQSPHGLSYVTGGGGMVLSKGAVSSIVQSSRQCPSSDYPDDMFLGSVARQLHCDLIHSPLFHQSQPSSFPRSSLELQTPVSFHRHHPQDPLLVYHTHLQEHAHTGADEEEETGRGKSEL